MLLTPQMKTRQINENNIYNCSHNYPLLIWNQYFKFINDNKINEGASLGIREQQHSYFISVSYNIYNNNKLSMIPSQLAGQLTEQVAIDG